MDFIYENESRKIIGACFKVYNTIGYGYSEKEYQKALAVELDKLGMKFVRELYSDLFYEGQKLRGYYLDFLIESLIILELKVANRAYQKHYYQTLQYLKNHNLSLGLIIVFSPAGVIIKRVVNLK